MLVDYSKNAICDETMALLRNLAIETDVIGKARRMYFGEKINETEGRAVLLVALRNRPIAPIYIDGVNVMPEINMVMSKIEVFMNNVRSGKWVGHTGRSINTVVIIGIGGSDLGLVMVKEALKPYSKRDMKMHFVSNVDGSHVSEVLRMCDPETMLFLVASKT